MRYDINLGSFDRSAASLRSNLLKLFYKLTLTYKLAYTVKNLCSNMLQYISIMTPIFTFVYQNNRQHSSIRFVTTE